MIGHGNGSATRRGAAPSPRHRRLDERGIALPMALIFVALLTMLMLAFGVLGQSEGVIASNHMLMAQARAQAESGFERAVWALTASVQSDPPDPMADPPPAPYNGNEFVRSGLTGGYMVLIQPDDNVPPNPDVRRVTARGCATSGDSCDTQRAQRIVQARVIYQPPFPRLTVQAPCALCVRGNVGVSGNALIDGRQADPSPGLTECGPKKGVVAVGSVSRSGDAHAIYGHGTGTSNVEGTDYEQNASPAYMDALTLGPGHMDQLRELAKANGTYFGPGYPNGGTEPVASPPWSGSIGFSSSNKVKDGVVFIDTISGDDIPEDHSLQNAADFANVSITGNPFQGCSSCSPATTGIFTGWLIVNGSLQISGNMQLKGTVYSINDFTYNGTGTGRIDGLVISQNIRDTSETSISDDSATSGNSRIRFDCEAARTPEGWIQPPRFALEPGSYREIAGDSL